MSFLGGTQQTVSLFFLGTKRVHNNIVYNEYISHREHIHMNATQWETLTDFTKWLGREGKKRTVELVFHGFISVREVIVSFYLILWKVSSLGQLEKQEGNLLFHSYFVICHFCLLFFETGTYIAQAAMEIMTLLPLLPRGGATGFRCTVASVRTSFDSALKHSVVGTFSHCDKIPKKSGFDSQLVRICFTTTWLLCFWA